MLAGETKCGCKTASLEKYNDNKELRFCLTVYHMFPFSVYRACSAAVCLTSEQVDVRLPLVLRDELAQVVEVESALEDLDTACRHAALQRPGLCAMVSDSLHPPDRNLYQVPQCNNPSRPHHSQKPSAQRPIAIVSPGTVYKLNI